jgi:hypothetical protein
MEHYCINCDGIFKDAKFDHDYGRCNKCSKAERKRDRKRQAIFHEYADIQKGDMMEWCGHMCIVTHVLPDKGWVVHVPKLGEKQIVYVWADDNLETFSRRLGRYRPPSETDKN